MASTGRFQQARAASARIAKFGLLQLANALLPLVVLPVVVRLIGTDGWVSMANGMGVGAVAAMAVGMAWPVTGPPRVAGAPLNEARRVFVLSLAMRALVFVPVAVIACVVLWLLLPYGGDPWLPCAMALATAMNGLTSNWYYIGRAEPGGIWLFDSMPKLVATAVAIPTVYFTHLPVAYPIALLLASSLALVVSALRVLGGTRPAVAFPTVLAEARAQVPLGVGGLLSTGSTGLAVPMATAAGAGLGAVAGFAAALRLRTMAQAGISAWTSALQSWVSENGVAGWRRRAPQAVLSSGIVGLAAALVVGAFSPWLSHIVFAAAAPIDAMTGWLLGGVCWCYAVSSSLTNHVLAPAGRNSAILSATMVGSLASIGLILTAAQWRGAPLLLAAVLVSEALVVGIQGVAARRALRDTLMLVNGQQLTSALETESASEPLA